MKNIIDFIIKVGVEGLEAGKEMVNFFLAGFTKIGSLLKFAVGWIAKFKVGISMIMGSLGAFTQILSLVISVWQMFKERADKAAAAASEAIAKQQERIQGMTDALKEWKSKLSENDRLDARLAKEKLITAEYEARSRAVKEQANAQALADRLRAMREGREEDAARAQLDMQLLSGNITEEQHALATFELSRVASANRHRREMDSAQATRKQAEKNKEAAEERLNAAQTAESLLKTALGNIKSPEDWKKLAETLAKATAGVGSLHEQFDKAKEVRERKEAKLDPADTWLTSLDTEDVGAKVKEKESRGITSKRLEKLRRYYRARVAEDNARAALQRATEEADTQEAKRVSILEALRKLGFNMSGAENQEQSIAAAVSQLEDLAKETKALSGELKTATEAEEQAEAKIRETTALREEEIKTEAQKGRDLHTRLSIQASKKQDAYQAEEAKADRAAATRKAETAQQEAESHATAARKVAQNLLHRAETRKLSPNKPDEQKRWDVALSTIKAQQNAPELLAKLGEVLSGKKVKWTKDEVDQVRPFMTGAKGISDGNAAQLVQLIQALLRVVEAEKQERNAKSIVEGHKQGEAEEARADDFHKRDMERLNVEKTNDAAAGNMPPALQQIINSAGGLGDKAAAVSTGFSEISMALDSAALGLGESGIGAAGGTLLTSLDGFVTAARGRDALLVQQLLQMSGTITQQQSEIEALKNRLGNTITV